MFITSPINDTSSLSHRHIHTARVTASAGHGIAPARQSEPWERAPASDRRAGVHAAETPVCAASLFCPRRPANDYPTSRRGADGDTQTNAVTVADYREARPNPPRHPADHCTHSLVAPSPQPPGGHLPGRLVADVGAVSVQLQQVRQAGLVSAAVAVIHLRRRRRLARHLLALPRLVVVGPPPHVEHDGACGGGAAVSSGRPPGSGLDAVAAGAGQSGSDSDNDVVRYIWRRRWTPVTSSQASSAVQFSFKALIANHSSDAAYGHRTTIHNSQPAVHTPPSPPTVHRPRPRPRRAPLRHHASSRSHSQHCERRPADRRRPEMIA